MRGRFRLGCIFVIALVISGFVSAKGSGWAALVCKNIATNAEKGVDTLVANSLFAHLGYTVAYLDEDVIRPKSFYDTFTVVVSVGDEVSGLTTNNLDSLGQSTTGWVALGYRQWNEINLGTTAIYAGSGVEDTRDYYVYSYVNNINSSHFITRTSQDTINAWNGDAHIFLGLPFPDSCHNIKGLIVSPPRKSDTAKVELAVADDGDTIINTGDGNWQAKGRRVFFGLFSASSAGIPSSTGSAADSCLLWKVFERAVAWAAKDTLNVGVTKRRCASGAYEMLMPFTESSGGTGNSVFRNYPYNYVGIDYDEKVSFLRLRDLATFRMFVREYRSVWAKTVTLTERFSGALLDHTLAWDVHYTWKPLKIANRIAPPGGSGSCTYSATCPFSCWNHAWMDTVGGANVDHNWNTLGARGSGTDYYNEMADSVIIKYTDNPVVGDRYSCDLPTARFNSSMLDTATALGWVSVTYYANADAYGGGAEISFNNHIDFPNKRPVLLIDLDSFSVTSPSPHIVLSDDSLGSSGYVGGTAPTIYLLVSNSAGGAMVFVPTNDSTWMTLVCVGDCNAPDYVTGIFDYGARPVGTYVDTIRVTSTDADNSPQKCVVTLTITATPPPGQVQKMSGFLRTKQ